MINRGIATPIYRQLADIIEAKIGVDYGPGDKLQTEQELATQFQVNRLTARRALEELARAGLVESRQGVGTFVTMASTKWVVDANSPASFSQRMTAQGHNVQLNLLQENTDNDDELKSALGATGLRCFKIARHLDGIPWSTVQVWLPTPKFADIDQYWRGDSSLHQALSENYGIQTTRGDRTFGAERADSLDSEHLAIPVGAPVLVVEGFNVSADGENIAFVRHRFRGDRTQYCVGLTPQEP